MTNTTIPWVQWAARAWGDNWHLGRKTEKSIRRLSRWDASSQTYKPPRFVAKDEYYLERDRWWSYRVDLLENALARAKITEADDYQFEIDNLKEEVTDLENQIKLLEKDKEHLEELVDEKQKETDPMLVHVKSLLYQNNVSEALIYLERGSL